jgi:hypothetical protein
LSFVDDSPDDFGGALRDSYEYALRLHEDVRQAERELRGAARTPWDWDEPTLLGDEQQVRLPELPVPNLLRLRFLRAQTARIKSRSLRAAIAASFDRVIRQLDACRVWWAQTSDRRPVGDVTPTVAYLRAHVLLTAAP